MFVFPENYSCIYKIPPQKQNYAKKNCRMTKRAHISQFSLEILQRPCKLLIKNEGNQSRHLLEKLIELNKVFHFWSKMVWKNGFREPKKWVTFISLPPCRDKPLDNIIEVSFRKIMKGSWKEGSCSCFQCKHPFLHFSDSIIICIFLLYPCMRDLENKFSYYLNHVQVPVGVSSPINTGSSQVQCWCCLIYSFLTLQFMPLQCLGMCFIWQHFSNFKLKLVPNL